MKNIKLLLPVLLFVTLFGCNDMLDEEPRSLLSPENLYQTEEDGKVAVIGIYEGMRSEATWRVAYHVRGIGTMGDDILCCTNQANQKTQMGFASYTLSSSHKDVRENWAAIYKVINRANEAILNLPRIPDDSGVVNSFIAEAKFMRALHYFDLVRFYGAVPLKLEPTKTLDNLDCPRTPESDVYKQIVDDLKDAEKDLTFPVEGRASVNAVKTLLAEVYLTMAGAPLNLGAEYFQLARDKAKEVVDAIALPGQNPSGVEAALNTYASFFTEMGETTSEEDLFSVLFTASEDLGGSWGYRSISGGNRTEEPYHYYYGGSQVNANFALSFHDSDIRFKWSIGSYKLNAKGRVAAPVQQWTSSKFRYHGRPGNPWNGGGVNAPVLRVAHAYLIFAEAENEVNGPTAEAYAAINAVRNRAMVPELSTEYLAEANQGTEDMAYGMSSVSFDKEADSYNQRHVYYDSYASEQDKFRQAIKMERAWEFCFERQRWFDLKRWDDLYEVVSNVRQMKLLQLNNTADPIDKSDLNVKVDPQTHYYLISEQWPATAIQPYHNYMPIPELEIRLNNHIDFSDQNPGY